MAETAALFERVCEAIYYRQTAKISGQVVPGIWERSTLLDRLGTDRLAALEQAKIIVPLGGQS